MKKLLILLLMIISLPTNAELYLDLGAQYLAVTDYHHELHKPQSKYFGHAELGYTVDNITIYISHDSDMLHKDKGMNYVGAKFRITFSK